ncbi:MAG: transposase [Elusimicrobiota bacterium]
MRKWRRLHEPVARSLEEAGDDLLAFMSFPKERWKALRTTNIIERLNGAFRQRIKTQGMFPIRAASAPSPFRAPARRGPARRPRPVYALSPGVAVAKIPSGSARVASAFPLSGA